MVVHNGKQIYERWVQAWNQDISVLDDITSPDCTVHQARLDQQNSERQKGAEALKDMIGSGCAFFDDVKMSIETGPIEEGNYVSARWRFTGTYNGTMPGAQAKAGKVIAFQGMDIFFLEDGKIKDYWVSSDGVHFMQQMGML
ncbi:ester cyclase [Gracilibacillus phocaeensis]|uniref:ester cyclase n=1 Tax=Gracilibacillus phocaeensis TaxID=2042304 RepID=UPI0010301956|nr:ester cyclase [Gracilibacillus phocaeensis]